MKDSTVNGWLIAVLSALVLGLQLQSCHSQDKRHELLRRVIILEHKDAANAID